MQQTNTRQGALNESEIHVQTTVSTLTAGYGIFASIKYFLNMSQDFEISYTRQESWMIVFLQVCLFVVGKLFKVAGWSAN